MRKKEISNSGHYATNGLGKAQATVNSGQKGYSKKSNKASKPSRRRNERANAGKNQRKDSRLLVFKLADLLPDETIKKLRGIENGRKTKSND